MARANGERIDVVQIGREGKLGCQKVNRQKHEPGEERIISEHHEGPLLAQVRSTWCVDPLPYSRVLCGW